MRHGCWLLLGVALLLLLAGVRGATVAAAAAALAAGAEAWIEGSAAGHEGCFRRSLALQIVALRDQWTSGGAVQFRCTHLPQPARSPPVSQRPWRLSVCAPRNERSDWWWPPPEMQLSSLQQQTVCAGPGQTSGGRGLRSKHKDAAAEPEGGARALPAVGAASHGLPAGLAIMAGHASRTKSAVRSLPGAEHQTLFTSGAEVGRRAAACAVCA